MRVAMLDAIADRSAPGATGLSDIVWRLATELAALGVTPVVVGPYSAKAAPRALGVSYRSAPAAAHLRSNLATILFDRFSAAAAAVAARCDCYYAVDSISAGALAVLGRGSRTVWHGHNNVLHHSQIERPWDRTMYHAMLWSSRLAARRVARVAVLGPRLAKWWTALGACPDRIVVVPIGIDLPSGARFPDAARQRPGSPAQLLYVGRLSPEKGGVDELLRAIHMRRTDGGEVTLDIAGDGPDRPVLERLAAHLKLTETVRFLGVVPPSTVSKLYRSADLVVLPSRGEMLPRVMLEAWAHGTPFLGTPVGAIPDYLVDGVNGFLVKDVSPASLERRLSDIIASPAHLAGVGLAGRDSARRLTWRRTAETLLGGLPKELRH